MKRRARSLLFFGLAAAAGLAGAAMVDGYQERTLSGLGDLRPVVVTSRPLQASRSVTPRSAERRLTVVRVPQRFAPSGAVAEPNSLIGLEPVGDLPAGTFISSALMRRPSRDQRAAGPNLASGRRPVEIRISGASALQTGARPRVVDVVVTSEPAAGGAARTYISASKVPLIELIPSVEGSEPGSARAVLGLSRDEALRLIRAESFARGIRLLPRPDGS